MAVVALGANAYNVDDFVYTKTAKYQVTGANLVVNGDFKSGDTGTDGWDAIDAVNAPLATTFTMGVGGPNGSNTQKVLAGQTALTAGMKQQIAIEMGGTYVVTLRVMGAGAGFTDLDLTGANVNYINAYYNTDGALATAGGKNNTELSYGENGVSGGYGFSFSNEGFTEVSFAIEAPAEGFIMLDFRGLNEGLEIADVECHSATQVYDDRIAGRRLAYLNKYFSAVDMTEREGYADMQAAIADVQNGIDTNADAETMAGLMESLNLVWDELFVPSNFSNVMNLIPTKDGSANTGNNSANWMNWTGKYNKLTSNYNGKAPWSWSTDRWCHKGTAVNSPMNIEWMRSSSGNWDNIATLTATLDAGTYFWGVSADGGMATLNKQRWARSWAQECIATQLFFNGDTTDIFMLDPAITNDYVFAFELKETKEITLGIRSNQTLAASNGNFTSFYNPVLYQLLVAGEDTPEQKAYIERFNVQLEALAGRIEVANGYLAAEQTAMPWGKEDLLVGVTEAKARYDAWKAMTKDEILYKMDSYEEIADTVMNSGVRFLNNNYITPFLTKNSPLTNMPKAIAAATATKEMRIYSGSAKKSDLEAEILKAQNMYDAKLLVPFSSEDSLALVEEKAALEALVVEFKNAITVENVIDIDFGTQEAPASIVKHEDPEGLVETYYTVAGAKGEMKMVDAEGTYGYALGYNGTDSLGILRLGNNEASVEIAGAPAKESDIVNIKFDFYAGNLITKYAGFYVMSEAGDTICGLYFSKYDGVAKYNPFGIDFNGKIPGVGSSSASNGAIAAASNKTQFDIVLDYGARTMYCTTVSSKGTATTETVALKNVAPAKFVLTSDYNNADRRCWFDNLEVNNIAADPTSVQGVTEVAPASQNADAIYNVAGQQISAPAKGQIYITNGSKFVK